MLESKIIEGTNTINITYSGSLSTEEMEQAQELLTHTAHDRGKVQLLLEYGQIDLGQIEPEAMKKDLQSLGLLEHMERIALVADQKWLQKITDALGVLTATEVRTFDLGQRYEALTWLAD